MITSQLPEWFYTHFTLARTQSVETCNCINKKANFLSLKQRCISHSEWNLSQSHCDNRPLFLAYFSKIGLDTDPQWNFWTNSFQMSKSYTIHPAPGNVQISKEAKLHGKSESVWLIRWYSTRFEKRWKNCKNVFPSFFLLCSNLVLDD